MIAPKVIKQLKHCLQPNLKDVTINWGNDVDITNSSQAPSKIPSLYNGSRVQIFRIVNNKSTNIPATIKISADVEAQGEEGFDEEVSVDKSGLKGTLLHKMSARKLIQELEDKEEMTDEKEVKELITELAMKYQLMSKYTSIVAVDDKENMNSQPMQTRSIANQMPNGFHEYGFRQECSRASMRRLGAVCADSGDESTKECVVEGIEFESMEESSPIDRVLLLIALQTAEGFFNKEEKIYTAFKIQQEVIEKLVKETNADSKIVYTILVCVGLEKIFSELKPCWELVVKKAEAYLNKNSASVGLKEKITALFN